MKPSSTRANEYCTISIFKAAFEILYAGVGWNKNSEALVIEPIVEPLEIQL
jgi:hypothetical protein